ncbi:uncharacterized protein TNIN_142841 [Trichonephila inaurata madagascariensis]|uniref:Uncharacterized protein n=1 Tax=Trichonephila inaurata madagascariensis TaxID=2747483 RepID=A0A8X6XTA7_9ARAC|nr:uncharacterized protein TNIN_142841 [Trichonephila inaurata madagascariensis]
MEDLFVAFVAAMRCMRSMNQHLSLLACLAVIFTMTGSFAGGYKMAFHPNNTEAYFLSLIFSVIFYLTAQLMIMLSASVTNELANKVKCVVRCLPYQDAIQDPKRKFKLKKYLNQDNSLTLWKVYVMDWSLIITSIGTLLTYGILIGTLGKGI